MNKMDFSEIERLADLATIHYMRAEKELGRQYIIRIDEQLQTIRNNTANMVTLGAVDEFYGRINRIEQITSPFKH